MIDISKYTDGIDNEVILDTFKKANEIINNDAYKNIACSVSGGADSDCMLDLCHKVDKDRKIKYVWFDTGIEYNATKEHLVYLEEKYGIKIQRIRALKSIPASCKEYGQPFLSKVVSNHIAKLQRHNFQWEDEPYDKLVQKYPKCQSSLKWWCNHKPAFNGVESSFNISRNKFLKEFMLLYPPSFPYQINAVNTQRKKSHTSL